MAEQLEVNSSTDLLKDFLSQDDETSDLTPKDNIIDGGVNDSETITTNNEIDIISQLPDDLLSDDENTKNTESTNDNESNDNSTNDASSDSKYSFKALASVLSEEGLIDFEDKEDLEDTPEVLFESIKNTVNKEIQSYKDSIPEKAKQIIEFMEKGGDLDEYLTSVQKPFDIKTLDLENENHQEKVVREYLKLQEYTQDEIDETITDYKDSLILEKQAKVATKQITKAYEKREQFLIEKVEQEQLQKQEQYNTYISTVNNTIDSAESLAGLPIDKSKRLEFKKYLLQADKEGLTQYAKEVAENPVQTQLELAYLKFLKFDFTNAVKAGETAATQKFKNIFKSNETNIKTGKSVGETSSSELSAFEQFKKNK